MSRASSARLVRASKLDSALILDGPAAGRVVSAGPAFRWAGPGGEATYQPRTIQARTPTTKSTVDVYVTRPEILEDPDQVALAVALAKQAKVARTLPLSIGELKESRGVAVVRSWKDEMKPTGSPVAVAYRPTSEFMPGNRKRPPKKKRT